jgi:hypothetical protein
MDPHRPRPADACLRDSGVPLWALISYLQRAVGGDIAQAAAAVGSMRPTRRR